MLKHIMYGKPGWWVLHIIVIALIFYLGHSVSF